MRPCCLYLLLLVVSCTSKMPKGILGEKAMENFLYDEHIARAAAAQKGDSVDFWTREYIEAAYRKHAITQAVFDSSLVWYEKHAEKLSEIYTRLTQRLAEQSGNHSLQAQTDTASQTQWQGNPLYVLSPLGHTNKMSFTLEPDTTLHAGDRLSWRFRTQFIYREGAREAICLLAVTYANDSVALAKRTISSTDDYRIDLQTDRKPIKQVYGCIYLNEPPTTTTKLLLISRPCLTNEHVALKELSTTPADTTAILTDTLQALPIIEDLDHNNPLVRRRRGLKP